MVTVTDARSCRQTEWARVAHRGGLQCRRYGRAEGCSLGRDETSVGGSLRTARLSVFASLRLEVWAGLQHKAVAVTTLAGKPLDALGRAQAGRQAGKDRANRWKVGRSIARSRLWPCGL